LLLRNCSAAPESESFDGVCSGEYTGGMDVNLTPELQAKPDKVAAQQGRDVQSLVQEAVQRLVDYDQWFVREVEKGLAQIKRGEVLEHEEVGARLEKLLSDKQRRT
jgi:predicted transcriptional regulator